MALLGNRVFTIDSDAGTSQSLSEVESAGRRLSFIRDEVAAFLRPLFVFCCVDFAVLVALTLLRGVIYASLLCSSWS